MTNFNRYYNLNEILKITEMIHGFESHILIKIPKLKSINIKYKHKGLFKLRKIAFENKELNNFINIIHSTYKLDNPEFDIDLIPNNYNIYIFRFFKNQENNSYRYICFYKDFSNLKNIFPNGIENTIIYDNRFIEFTKQILLASKDELIQFHKNSKSEEKNMLTLIKKT
jgi:hypothetical protein